MVWKTTCRIDELGRECSKCKQYKEWSQFPKDRNNRTGHTTACSQCRVAQHKAWVWANPEKYKASLDSWVSRNIDFVRERARTYAANRRSELPEGAYAASQVAYRLANPDKFRGYEKKRYLENGAQRLERTRKDRASNPARWAAYDAKKRAKRKAGVVAWSDESKVKALYGMARALRVATGLSFHVDHIEPLVSPNVQGLHVHQNLRIICAVDNLTKGNKASSDEVPEINSATLDLILSGQDEEAERIIDRVIDRARQNQECCQNVMDS